MNLKEFVGNYFGFTDEINRLTAINYKLAEANVELLQKEQDQKDSNLLEEKFNSKYPQVDELYSGRVLPPDNKKVSVDVRDFYTPNDSLLQTIVKNLALEGKTDDVKALACLQWVIKNLTYVPDSVEYKLNEFWAFPFEILIDMKDDCDGGMVLLMNLMLIAGIPYWKIRGTGGNVIDPNTNGLTGHAYVTYYCESTDKWVVMDWCFYPNHLPVAERKDYKDELNYKDIWFSFNQKFSFAKDVRDLKNHLGGN